MAIDPATKTGARALERLANDKIAWLTTVAPDGQPQSMPIWFLWEPDAGEILLYSQAGAVRNRNLQANPKVSFHFSDDGSGGDIVSIDGEARFDEEVGPHAKDHPAYLAKYGDWLKDYDWTPEYFSSAYPHPVRIRPTKVRGG
jgi:PPOX class probable F420-dependent enzyme